MKTGEFTKQAEILAISVIIAITNQLVSQMLDYEQLQNIGSFMGSTIGWYIGLNLINLIDVALNKIKSKK